MLPSSPLNFFVTYLLPRWREALIVALAVACYVLYHKPPVLVEREVERVREVIVEQEAEVVTRVVTRTVTVQPDGTRIEQESQAVTEAATVTRSETREVERTGPSYDPPRYSVAVDYGTDRRYGAEFGIRLGDLPLWLDIRGEMGYDAGRPSSPSLGAGIRYEF